MNKTIHRITNVILTCVIIMGSYINVQAAPEQLSLNVTGSIYYVSITGNDSNPGTLSSPFKTFSKANSVLRAGDTLNILPGTYNEALRISNSGAEGAWITVKPSGGTVTIDLRNSSSPAVSLQGSFIAVSNLDVKGSNDICVRVSGSYTRVSGLIVHECQTHGIYVTGQHVEVTGNVVYTTSLANQARTASSGWGSGIKIGLGGNDILVEGNTVFNNYGEGIAITRSSNVVVRGNTVSDNFSVNIYVDNSFDIWVEKNLVLCHVNSGFERSGTPASGISMGEEYYSGWGAQMNRVTVRNNIVAFCKNGIYYYGADSSLTNGGLKNSTIVHNTFWGSTSTTIGVVYETGQTNSLIANNIVWQANNKLVYMENSTGLTFHNNLWKVSPPAYAMGVSDKIGDPMFLATPGYSAETFILSALSPAIGGAINIGIATDYFGNQRGPSYEMGALEFLGANPSPTQAVSTNTPALPPTFTPTRTNVPTQIFTSTSVPLSATPTSVPPSATFTPVQSTPTSTTVPASPTLALSPTPISPMATVPISGMTYNDNDLALRYSGTWQSISRTEAFGGSYIVAKKPGFFVTLNFTGQAFSILYTAGSDFGKLDIYIDNQLITTLDQRASQNQFQKRWDYPGTLSAGAHEIKLVFSGPERSKGSLDAILVR